MIANTKKTLLLTSFLRLIMKVEDNNIPVLLSTNENTSSHYEKH